MAKRILLVSHCFAPQNKIGAVRPTKLAKYLVRRGHQVTVLCGKDYASITDPILARDLQQLKNVHVIAERSLFRWLKQRKNQMVEAKQSGNSAAKTGASGSFANTAYLYLADQADKAFARACKRRIKTMNQHYDVVISTYGPISVHPIARFAKTSGYAKHWIADFRDETIMPFAWQKQRLKRYNAMVMREADQITSISSGCLQVMGMEQTGCVIYNGFDPEDTDKFEVPAKRRDKLTFIHCGQMYGKQRDLTPFFHALAELVAENVIDKQSIALVTAGRDTGGFAEQAAAAGLKECLEVHGFIPRDQSVQLQKEAHVLLLPAWNMQDRQGNIPGKLLEYLMLDMPVVCCVSGDVPKSEIAGIIRKTNIGICYEQANSDADVQKLKTYLMHTIKAFQSGNDMPFEPNREEIAKFTSEGMAHKMENIFAQW